MKMDKIAKKSIFEILNLRFKFTELVKNLNVPHNIRDGDINSILWFVDHGHKSNRFKEEYREALNIANSILESC